MSLSSFRFSVRLLMLLVASVALVIGGFLWLVQLGAVREELAPQPLSASVDHEILDIVLGDLINNPEFINPYPTKTQIVVGDRTPRGYGDAGNELERWARENKVTSDVVDDVASRSPKGICYLLARYQPSNPNILKRKIDVIDLDTQFPKARGYVETRLPGYSRDGQNALLSFTFGPTPHGAVGFYLLKRVNGRWEIIMRSLYYYS